MAGMGMMKKKIPTIQRDQRGKQKQKKQEEKVVEFLDLLL